MKLLFVRSRWSKLSSFTLVELLVVMAIIIILAAVLTEAGTSAIRSAKRSKAMNTASQIQAACMGYYTEYGVYPIPSDLVTSPNADIYISATDGPHWKNLIWALCGNIDPAYPTGAVTPTVSNTRAIPFLSLNLSDVEHSSPPVSTDTGIPLNPIYPTGSGTYFNIAMDGSYDGILGNNGTANTAITNFGMPTMPQTTITAAVAVWANCNTGTTTNNNFYVHTY